MRRPFIIAGAFIVLEAVALKLRSGRVAGNIVVAWLLTIPAAGLVAAACYWPVEGIF